jgi:hypothetical protein
MVLIIICCSGHCCCRSSARACVASTDLLHLATPRVMIIGLSMFGPDGVARPGTCCCCSSARGMCRLDRPVTITRYNSWWSSGSRCSVLIVLISYVAPGTAAAAAVLGACVTSNRPTTGAERYDEERAYAARHGDAAQHYETFMRRRIVTTLHAPWLES